jgi:hypothetical protein
MIRNILFFLLFISTAVQAQKGTLSPYSFYGIGETLFRGTAEQRMMGGFVSYADSISHSISSPASLANLKMVNYSIGANHRNNKFDSQGNAISNTTAGIDYLAVAVPTKHFGFAFGLMPHSAVGYRLRNVDDPEEISFGDQYEGSGGINQVFLSFGFSPIKNLAVGVAFHYNFGQVQRSHVRFDQNIDLSTQLFDESLIRGTEWNISAAYKQDWNSKLYSQFHVSYRPEVALQSENNRSITTFNSLIGSVNDAQEIDLSALGLDVSDIDLPTTYTLGMGLGENQKWYAGVQWIQSESGINNPYLRYDNASYESSKQLSVGGFFIPEYDSFSSYWKRIIYRVGVRTGQTGLRVNGTSIDDFGINFGLGLPIAGLSTANIGVELGKMGATVNNLAEENYVTIRIGFSLNDLWFIKRQYD